MAGSQLSPEWPDTSAAWTRVDERLMRRPSRVWVWAGATAALVVAALALPAPRAIAQRLWDQVVLGRIQVLITNYDEHGAAASVFSPDIQHRPEPHPVASLEEAGRIAGFSPQLPAHVFVASPSYSVTDELSATLPLRTPAMRYLLAQAGGSASDVPESWNAVVLDVRAGPIVIADYNGTLLLQSPPLRMIKPADFDLELFYRIAFRSLGMSEQKARLLSADAEFSPALLTFMPKEDTNLLREFTTNTGKGMMIAEVYGPGTITALWGGRDRVYALWGQIDADLVTRVANALD
jgi:hypothetical protein